MSKYSKEQLKTMANETLNAKRNKDPKFEMLMITMVMATGLDPEEVLRRIQALADG